MKPSSSSLSIQSARTCSVSWSDNLSPVTQKQKRSALNSRWVVWVFTKGEKGVRKFSSHHLAVLFFVVQLKTFQEVVEVALLLVFLALTEDGQELVQLQLLLVLLLGAAQFFDRGEGWVQVEGAEHVTNVDSVDCAIALEVVDGEHECCSCGMP